MIYPYPGLYGNLILEFIDHALDDNPKYSEEESKKRCNLLRSTKG